MNTITSNPSNRPKSGTITLSCDRQWLSNTHRLAWCMIAGGALLFFNSCAPMSSHLGTRDLGYPETKASWMPIQPSNGRLVIYCPGTKTEPMGHASIFNTSKENAFIIDHAKLRGWVGYCKFVYADLPVGQHSARFRTISNILPRSTSVSFSIKNQSVTYIRIGPPISVVSAETLRVVDSKQAEAELAGLRGGGMGGAINQTQDRQANPAWLDRMGGENRNQ